MVEQHIPTLLHALGRTLTAIQHEIASMHITMQSIEEIAAEARDRERKYGFKYEEEDFDDPRDDESPA